MHGRSFFCISEAVNVRGRKFAALIPASAAAAAAVTVTVAAAAGRARKQGRKNTTHMLSPHRFISSRTIRRGAGGNSSRTADRSSCPDRSTAARSRAGRSRPTSRGSPGGRGRVRIPAGNFPYSTGSLSAEGEQYRTYQIPPRIELFYVCPGRSGRGCIHYILFACRPCCLRASFGTAPML